MVKCMRYILMSLAFARTQHVSAPSRRGLLNQVLMHVGAVDSVEHFEGSFYGVSAKVELNMRTRIAMVHLNGVALGGRVSGTGWLKQAGATTGAVVLERSFEKRLRRRFVTISSAHLNSALHTVTVSATVPVLGTISLVLT